MADAKISALTAATTPLAGTEVLPIVQSGTTKKVAVSDLTAGRAVACSDLTTTGNTILGNAGSDTLNVGNGGLVKDASGNLGIGTASPTEKLTIGGINASNNTDQNALQFIDANSNKLGKILSRRGVNGNNGILKFLVGNDDIVAMTMDSTSGDLTANTGNLVIGTAGKGIDFSADGQAAGMTSELLDDYEEGTFTPVIADASTGGNAGTAEFSFAHYTKIGREVFFNINLINVNTSGLTSGNTLFLRGLPFTSGNWCNGFTNMAAVTNFTYAGTMVNAEVYAGGTYIRFYDVKSATGGTLLTVAAITSGSCNIYINGMYEV